MWRTKESVPPGDEARGGNWFQMKQEVESGDKERAVSDRGKGGRAPSLDTNTHTVRVYSPCIKRIFFLSHSYLFVTSGPFFNLMLSFPLGFPLSLSV